MAFKNICVLVIWMKVASTLEGLTYGYGKTHHLVDKSLSKKIMFHLYQRCTCFIETYRWFKKCLILLIFKVITIPGAKHVLCRTKFNLCVIPA